MACLRASSLAAGVSFGSFLNSRSSFPFSLSIRSCSASRSSSQKGDVSTATTFPLNSSSEAGFPWAWRKCICGAFFPSFSPPMPITPMTNGIFGADKSFRTSRIRWPSSSAYWSYPPGLFWSG